MVEDDKVPRSVLGLFDEDIFDIRFQKPAG